MATSADLVASALNESEVSVASHAMWNGGRGPASAEVVALHEVRSHSSLVAVLTRQ